MYQCPECSETYASPRGMAIHRAQMHRIAGASSSARYRAEEHAPHAKEMTIEPGLIGLLTAVVERARLDAAAHSTSAARWLADLRDDLRRRV